MAAKVHSRQDMESIQYVFCKRFQREQDPAKNISVRRLWDNNQHDFVEQIETAVDAVATKVPYIRQQIVSIAFTIVENAGIYYDGVKEWRQKDTADKTWEAFKTYFRKRVQRYKSPTTDISVRRLWNNNQHERRTCKRRGI